MKPELVLALLCAFLTSAATVSPALAHEGEMHSGQQEGTVPQTAEGEGVVKAVDQKAGKVTLDHEPIAALNWPAMTMTFKVASSAVLNNVSVGQKVHFMLKNDNGKPVVTEIHPL